MMICNADFDELFPDLFCRPLTAAAPRAPEPGCLARWEDDGGRIPAPQRPRAAPSVPRRAVRAGASDPLIAGLAAAMIPAAILGGSVLAAMAAHARMMRAAPVYRHP